MKIALIPPYSLLQYMDKTKYQLILPQCLLDSAPYLMKVQELKRRGAFIILDNGAADHGLMSWEELCKAAEHIGAHELVLPDVMGAMKATWVATREALRLKFRIPTGTQLMGVLQGSNEKDIRWLLDMYNKVDEITTVGVPRCLAESFGRRAARIGVAETIRMAYGNRFQIHFLGSQPGWAREPHAVALYCSYVRSFDTSMPFNYAWHGKTLHGLNAEPVKRPDGYFDLPAHKFNQQLVGSNVDTILRWAAIEPAQ